MDWVVGFMPELVPCRKRVVRRKAEVDEANRKHIMVAWFYLCTDWSTSQIGLAYGVSRWTINRWIHQALALPEADFLIPMARVFRAEVGLSPTKRELL